MTTYSKETALYDTGAIKNGIDEAATKATNYLTTISGTTGISVHNANDEKNFVNMNSTDGVTIYRNIDGTATDVANFGEKVRVGEKDGSRLEVDSNGITGYVSNGKYLSVDGSGAIDKTSEVIYSTDEEVQIGDSYVILTNVYPELKTKIHSIASGDSFEIRGNPSGISVDFPTLTMQKGTAYSIETSGQTLPPPMQDSYFLYPASIVYDGNEEIKIKNKISQTVNMSGVTLSIVTEGRTPALTFGRNNQATGAYSVALNIGTKATGYAQTVIGYYNEPDDGKLFIIGNGVDEENRDNVFAVDWLGDVYPQGLKMTDFVVEQSTSGNWTYTKWNSGKCEQWYSGNPGSYTVGTTRGQLRSGGYINYTYPVAFVAYPSVTVNATLTTDTYVVWAQASNHSNTGVSVRIVASANIAASSNYNIHIYAVGRWK